MKEKEREESPESRESQGLWNPRRRGCTIASNATAEDWGVTTGFFRQEKSWREMMEQ